MKKTKFFVTRILFCLCFLSLASLDIFYEYNHPLHKIIDVCIITFFMALVAYLIVLWKKQQKTIIDLERKTQEVCNQEKQIQRANEIFNQAPFGFHVYKLEDQDDDTTLRLVMANPAASCLVGGLSNSEIINKTIDQNFPELRDSGIPQKYANAIRQKKNFEVSEIWYRDDRIEEQCFRVKGFVLSEDHLCIFFENITEQKQLDKKLYASKERLSSIFNAMKEGVVVHTLVFNEQGQAVNYWVKEVNKSFVNITGISAKKALGVDGKGCLANVVYGQIPYLDIYETVVKEKVTKVFQRYYEPINKHLAISVVPLGENGFITVFADITDFILMEQEVYKVKILESLGILAGGIAHDFNNILSGVLGNISLAIVCDIDFEAKTRLFEAERAVLRARGLANQLLTFAKGGSPIKEKINLAKMLRECVVFNLHGSELAPKFLLAPNLFMVKVDPNQMHQVFSNIVINAREAAIKSDELTVMAENVVVERNSTLRILAGDYVKISIRDKGTGIPRHIIDKIFDPFFTTKQKDSSGLGLAICYSIINRHNGCMKIESKTGEGTCVIIYLKANEVTRRIKPKKIEKVIKLKNKFGKILVLDDEEVIRDVAVLLLAHIGYSSEVVDDGVKAIEVYRKALVSDQPFTAVILDLTVPGCMGGKETIVELLKIDPNLKAIVSSGYSNSPVVSCCEDYGFKGFLNKPYSRQELEEILSKIL